MGRKGLKKASFGVINSKNFRGGIFRPPLHPSPTNLFVENYIKNGGKGLKNASFWVINSKNFRPARRKLVRRGKKMISKKGGGKNDRIGQYIPLGGYQGNVS